MTCLAVSGGVPPLLALAGGRLLSRKTGEIIPVPIIFSRVGFAEIPALRAVRGLGRRPIASLATPFPVAQPHLRCARSEEHTSELQSLMRISYAVFCLKKKKTNNKQR